MSIVLIGDWGKNEEGVFTYRINATKKDDIHIIIAEAKEAGFKFWETPSIIRSHKTWSVLLKLFIPKEQGE